MGAERWLSSAAIVSTALCGCLVSFQDYPVSDRDAGSDAAAPGGAGGSAGVGGTAGAGGSAGSKACTDCFAVPDDWQGPVAVAVADSAALLPGCPQAFPDPLPPLTDELAVPKSCGPCPCDPQCEVTLRFFFNADCTAPFNTPQSIDFGTCAPTLNSAAESLHASSAPKCTKLGEAQPDPLIWGKHAKRCGLQAPISCRSGMCAEEAPPGFDRCVYRTGDWPSCPAGFAERSLLYETASDDRACAACDCVPGVNSCAGTLVSYPNDQCATGVTTCPAIDNTMGWCCNPGASGAAFKATSTTNQGICSSNGGAFAGGQAVPSGPVTICCE